MKSIFLSSLVSTLVLTASIAWGQSLRPIVDPTCGLPGVRILSGGQGGGDFRVLGTTALGPDENWETLGELTIEGEAADWLDFDGHRHGQRFFRVEHLPVRPPLTPADNFRLIDQWGRSHELHRSAPAVAHVLVFADTAALAEAWAELRELRAAYESKGVVFWVVNSVDDYASMVAQAKSMNLDLPVLHDRSQLVARAYRCGARLEAVAIRGDDLTPFYRGAISERCDTGATPVVQRYLSDAIAGTLADKPVAVSFARGSAGAMPLRPAGSIDYSADVAPILLQRCVRCHRKGDIGSFEMSSHAVLVEKADKIRRDILTGDMPPWHVDPNISSYSNDFSLRPEEASKLLAWLDAGLPRGVGADPLVVNLPPPAQEWPLGEPDYKIALDEFVVPASGTVDYQYIFMRNPLPTNAWLRATALKPGNRGVVHHALVFAGSTSELLALSGGLGGYFAAYVPGMDQTENPEGTGKSLKAGSWLVFQMHYTTSGVETKDRTEIGLYFAKQAPKRELKTTAAYNTGFVIPARAGDHTVQAATKPFAKAAYLYEVSPHMHYRGSRMRFEVVLPDGKVEPLTNVPAYQFDWQTLYRLSEPKWIPAGAYVRVIGGFNNSATNARLLPTGLWGYDQEIRFGEQSWEEMLIGYINYADAP